MIYDVNSYYFKKFLIGRGTRQFLAPVPKSGSQVTATTQAPIGPTGSA